MIDALWQAAAQAFDSGNLDEADRLCRQGLSRVPDHPDFCLLSAQIFMLRGDIHSALPLLQGLYKKYPKVTVIALTLADAYRTNRQHDQAKKVYERLLKSDVNKIPVWGGLGLLAMEASKFQLAEDYFRKILKHDAENVSTWLNLGNLYREQQNGVAAIECYERVIKLAPTFVGGYNNLANQLMDEGRFVEAGKVYERALQLDQGNSRLWESWADAWKGQDNYEQALNAYQQALMLDAGNHTARYKFSILLLDLHRTEEAMLLLFTLIRAEKPEAKHWVALAKAYIDLALFRSSLSTPNGVPDIRSFEIKPAHLSLRTLYECAIHCCDKAISIDEQNVAAYDNKGLALTYLDKYSEARECFLKANSMAENYAQAHFHRGLNLLLNGQWAEGFKEYAWRLQIVDPLSFLKDYPILPKVVDARKMSELSALETKKVLVVYDQGLGDELFFLSFLPKLRHKVKWLGYWPNKKLVRLLRDVIDVDQLVSVDSPPQAVDLVIPVSDLPTVVEVEKTQLPAPVSLKPSAQALDEIKALLEAKLNVPLLGVTWRAGPAPTPGVHHVLSKQIPIDLIANSVREWPGEIIVLQRQPTEQELDSFGTVLNRDFLNLSSINEDLNQMLALLSLLTEYIGVSNTNMYLRNSLNMNARVLIPHPPEWRWMATGSISPWFPNFKIYRENVDHGWNNALLELEQDLLNSVKVYGKN